MHNHLLNARRGNKENVIFEFSEPGYELSIDVNDGKITVVRGKVGEASPLHQGDFDKAIEGLETKSNGNLQHSA